MPSPSELERESESAFGSKLDQEVTAAAARRQTPDQETAKFKELVAKAEAMKKGVITGVSKDEPISTNTRGGKQSASQYSLTASFPHRAVLDVAKVVKYGLEKYAPDNWRLISRDDHLNHVLVHLFAYLAGDKQDDHLEHAACRILFALECE